MISARILILCVITGYANAWPPRPSSPWSSLRDGLSAWEAFKFDTNFTYEVFVGLKSMFLYPEHAQHDVAELRNETVRIEITGAKESGEMLKRVTGPHVAAILQGRDPGIASRGCPPGVQCATLSQGGDVSREELLSQGGGLTVPDLLTAVGAEPKRGDKWQILRDAIDVWAALEFDVNFTVNIGDENGTIFTYTKGSVDMHKRLQGASLSKWPAALMVAGLVADGTMSFDDKANKYLNWWARDPTDSRSHIKLRHLLSFQSGYLQETFVLCALNPYADFLTCAEGLYNASKHQAAPGHNWSYTSQHLQFATAMAVSASGLSPQKLFQKYLYSPCNMTATSWAPLHNPQIASGITTTGADFEKMLHKMLNYEFPSKAVLHEMEQDLSVAPVTPSGDGWFGHYGMGHWIDCLGYSAGQTGGAGASLTEFCSREAIQSGPGALGWYPLIDRKRQYYFQIVLAEDRQCRSEIPEYLRTIAKPVVDAIIEGKPISSSDLLSRMGGLVLREISDIYNYVPPQCRPRGEEEVISSFLI